LFAEQLLVVVHTPACVRGSTGEYKKHSEFWVKVPSARRATLNASFSVRLGWAVKPNAA
jgi:hypothetical protein